MKTIVLATAFVLSGISTFATAPFTLKSSPVMEFRLQEEFKEIKSDQLPQAVKDALAADYPSAFLDKAYVNDAEQYKLDLIIDEVGLTVYADKEGNWIDKE